MITLKSQREIEAMDRAGDFCQHPYWIAWTDQAWARLTLGSRRICPPSL